MARHFVDPSILSLPSPQSDAPDSPQPSQDDSAPGPSRKRPRTDMSADERKEARAHRNRIAAQNSRDKRKAQYTAMERRIAELEEENRQLRAGMHSSDSQQRADDRRQEEELEREKARERENAELKERIKSLEKGWEAVMKVLASQGLPTPSASTPTDSPSNASPSPSNSTTTFPVLVPSTPVFHTTPVFPITPSPSVSNASIIIDADESESTRHLARRVDSTRLFNLLTPLPSLPLRRRTLRQPRVPAHRLRTKQPWTRGFAKSSRVHPSCRRRLFLILSAKSQPFHSPRPPPSRRR
ncbi:hypothetical protein DFH11DRAFT_1849159 [Phellopilus nigrolimitatus]|nr:hypothetical protein DFH11DRAFT_1849159 [Phellopilus nigrolimitatus]